MNFELIIEYINELLEFVKPVAGLVSDWFNNLFVAVPVFKQVFFIAVSIALVSISLSLIIKATSD